MKYYLFLILFIVWSDITKAQKRVFQNIFLLEIQKCHPGADKVIETWVLGTKDSVLLKPDGSVDNFQLRPIIVKKLGAPEYLLFCCEKGNVAYYSSTKLISLRDSLIGIYISKSAKLEKENSSVPDRIDFTNGYSLFDSKDNQIHIKLYNYEVDYCKCIPFYNTAVVNKNENIASILAIHGSYEISEVDRNAIKKSLKSILGLRVIHENFPSISKYLAEIPENY